MVLVDAPGPAAAASGVMIDAALREALARSSVKDAAAEVAARLGAPKREVYARALALKGEAQ